MKHMLTRQLNNPLILFKLTITNRTQIRLLILLMITNLRQTTKLLLTHPGVLVWIRPPS